MDALEICRLVRAGGDAAELRVRAIEMASDCSFDSAERARYLAVYLALEAADAQSRRSKVLAGRATQLAQWAIDYYRPGCLGAVLDLRHAARVLAHREPDVWRDAAGRLTAFIDGLMAGAE